MNDYIITVDENGQPYIAHAFGDGARAAAGRVGSGLGRGVRKSHKYLMKIGEGVKARYFYTQEEVRAYQNAMANKARGIINKQKKEFKSPSERVNAAAERVKNAARNKRTSVAGKVENTVKDIVNNKIKSAPERMKEEFRKKKETVKDKIGFDERENTKKIKEVSDAVKNKASDAVSKLKDATKDKVSEAADAASKLKGAAKDKVSEASDAVKNKASDAASKLKDATKDKVSEASDAVSKLKDATKDKVSEASDATSKLKGAAKDKVSEASDAVKNKASDAASKLKDATNRKAKFGEYDKNDPDFSDENYDKAKSIGDTDFAHFKRADGTSVILEEDMKWVLPKGVDANDPKIQRAIKQFADQVESARAIGKNNYTGDEWLDAVNKAIDDAVEDIRKDKKK